MNHTFILSMMSQKQSFVNYHPPTYSSCNIILLNMKSHYRRLYSVKPAVDTSPPESYKLISRKTNKSISCLDLSLSNISTDYFIRGSERIRNRVNMDGESGSRIKPIIKRHSCINSDINSNRLSRSKNKISSAVSGSRKTSNSFLTTSNVSKGLLQEKVLFDSSKSGSDSSQDSAYNEGEVVSSERGSPSPSPETVDKKLSSASLSPFNASSRQRKVNNYVYLKFLTSITDEILNKGLVTNKALKQVFRQHYEANLHQLNQSRMLLELEALREKLGVPEDDVLNSSDFGLGCGTGLPKCQPLSEDKFYSEQSHLALSSKKPKAGCVNGSAFLKNCQNSEMVEAFTTLNDNKNLIENIQASIKKTSINLAEVSEMSSHLSNYAETDYLSRSYSDCRRKSGSRIQDETASSEKDFFRNQVCRNKSVNDTEEERQEGKLNSDDYKRTLTSRSSLTVEPVLAENDLLTKNCNLTSDALFSDEDSVFSGENSLKNIGKPDNFVPQSILGANSVSERFVSTKSNCKTETEAVVAPLDFHPNRTLKSGAANSCDESRVGEQAVLNSIARSNIGTDLESKPVTSPENSHRLDNPVKNSNSRDETSSGNGDQDSQPADYSEEKRVQESS